MNGIVDQFAKSPLTKEINKLSVSASGTVSALMTGSTYDLLWRIRTNGGNTGEIRITTLNGTTQYWALEAGDDTGWIPGNEEGYFFYGQVAGDEAYLWRLR